MWDWGKMALLLLPDPKLADVQDLQWVSQFYEFELHITQIVAYLVLTLFLGSP